MDDQRIVDEQRIDGHLPSGERRPMPDAAARHRIEHDTAATLFVEAGAGSGKTTSLVDRIVTLVLDDGITLASIAAVTFTEKAGAELRDRLRDRFQQRSGQAAVEPHRSIAIQALDDLDAAAIGTLHSFAQRILTEHPIEARIPPLIEVLDEVGSSVAFAERWTALLADLLDDDAVAEPLLLALALGVELTDLRTLAQRLGSDWDLIADRVLTPDPTPFAVPDLSAFAERARIVATHAAECRDPDDKLLIHFVRLASALARFDAAPNDQGRLAEIQAMAAITYSNGKAGAWPDKPAVVAAGKALKADAEALLTRITSDCLRHLTRWIGAKVLEAAGARRAEGRLEFHDLLVLARDLLRHHPAVREALHEHYERLLLDEFQDTDPIQIELAVRIAGGAAAEQPRWQDVTVPPGRLFVVGDPKQSIYRFRRASIATYLEAQERLGERVHLTTNFRSVEPILLWIDDLFGTLIQPVERAQPQFVPLDAGPTSGWNFDAGAPVTLLGAREHDDAPNAATLREREAADVGVTVRRVLTERWLVRDGATSEWRQARLTDIAILVPARTSLPFLEDALAASGIPYRAEASSLVYQAQEVRDLLATARAIADSSDRFALVTALRSPLFGCGDDDLWTFRRDGGVLSLFAPVLDELAGTPVGSALAQLRDLAIRSRWLSPSELLGTLVTERRMFEVAAGDRQARDTWRRLRFVVDQARAWSAASQGGLRTYLAWAAFQGEEVSRVAEAVLPETDTESVRIMTIHAAKGLEFPIVILSGMSSQRRPRSGVSLLWTEAGYEVKTGKASQTEEFEVAAPLDEQMGEYEHIRLLYVAATRAKDHLVVSLHRSTRGVNTSARVLAAALPEGFDEEHPPVEVGSIDRPLTPSVEPPPALEQWLERTTTGQERARAVPAISASGLEGTAPELVLAAATEEEQGRAKGARDAELPPWTKGRYGSAIGRAVHGVLQVVDLAAGPRTPRVAAAVRAQSVAEGVTDQAELVGQLVASALQSDVVQRAAAREHWRESFVGTTLDDGTVLEGFIDLLYREDDGSLVVVDYKTDAVPTGGIPSRVQYYRPQIEAYLRAVRDATGAPTQGVLLFTHPAGALEERIE